MKCAATSNSMSTAGRIVAFGGQKGPLFERFLATAGMKELLGGPKKVDGGPRKIDGEHDRRASDEL